MSIEAGWTPPKITVVLVTFSPYAVTFEGQEPWAAGDVIDMLFTGGTTPPVLWTALITGARAMFAKSIAQVAQITNQGALREIDLRHTRLGAEPVVWYRGNVRVVPRRAVVQ